MISFIEGAPFIMVSSYHTIMPNKKERNHFISDHEYASYLASKIISKWTPVLIEELKNDLARWEETK